MGMSYSAKGEALTERFEADGGPKLQVYLDGRGRPSVGWGHTGADVHPGAIWTLEQCQEALLNDMAWVANVVNTLVHVSLTQPEFDALCDFVFNVGAGNFAKSTLLEDLNKGLFCKAAAQFDAWEYSNGKVVAGLLRRRMAETAEFKAGMTGDVASQSS